MVHDLGARALWGAALAGHVGATLAAYAGIGLLWLVARGSVRGDRPRAGLRDLRGLGRGARRPGGRRGVAPGLPPSPRPRRSARCACSRSSCSCPLHGELADVEHLLAFLLGAGVAAGVLRARGAAFRACS